MNSTSIRQYAAISAFALLAAAGGYGFALFTRTTPPTPVVQGEAKEVDSSAPNQVALTEAAIREAGIAVEPVKQGGLTAEIIAQALISPAPTGEAVVTARAGGAMVRVLKRLGDPVRAGEALAVVESRDAAQLVADRAAAQAKATLAQRNLERERYLYRERVSPRVDLERAQAEAAAAAAEARRAGAASQTARVTGDGRGVIVASPISGRVTASLVRLGAFVQPEAELFRVADPGQIQIEAAVGSSDAARLAAGDRAIIELPDGGTVEGRVRAVTPTLNGETRAATAVLDASAPALRPGLSVRVRLLPGMKQANGPLVVAEEAVQSLNGRDVVFVRTDKGFRVQAVRVGLHSAGRAEILEGLKAGQLVATTNAFLLKAELGKGAGEEE